MESFLGQVEIFGFDFAPRQWTTCAGQLLPISQYTALFSLLGTQYGGDGTSNFGLPDLRGRVAIGSGNGPGLSAYTNGQVGGEESHRLTQNEIANHKHALNADDSTPATNNTNTPSSSVVLGRTTGVPPQGSPFPLYLSTSGAPEGVLAADTVGITGGSPHPNQMPYLTLNFCICLNGIFPSRT